MSSTLGELWQAPSTKARRERDRQQRIRAKSAHELMTSLARAGLMPMPDPLAPEPPPPRRSAERPPPSRARTCQWIEDEGGPCCDAPSMPSRSWCEAHARHVFRPPSSM